MIEVVLALALLQDAEKKPAAEAPKDPKEPIAVTLRQLGAFPYEPPEPLKPGEKPPARDPFPEEIRKLHGKKVVVEGYMLPLRMQKGKISDFLLMPTVLACCFQDQVKMNEYVEVKKADGGPIKYSFSCKIVGKLEVGEDRDEDGYVTSLYRIVAETVEPVDLR